MDKLEKFRMIDKYASFYEILPEVRFSDRAQKTVLTAILNSCCKEMIVLFKTAKKMPTKAALKKVLLQSMSEISHAQELDSLNKEFGYRLGWFLAEKAEVNLPKQSAKKYWGYWQIENNEVRAVSYRKPRKKLK